MDLTQIPEMREYLEVLKSDSAYTWLLSEERIALSEADPSPEGIDWADEPGADTLHH